MIKGQPKKITPAFNAIYVYADSDKVNEPSFRYRSLTAVSTPDNPFELIADMSIRPRTDLLMEHNVNKILQSKLGDLMDDIDVNAPAPTIFHNTPSSGIDYVTGVNDVYQYSWLGTGITISFFGNLTLVGPEAALYTPGDIIQVEGLADRYAYTSITSGPNNYAKFSLSQPHNLTTGQFVLVQQNSPFGYPIYNGYYEVLIATNPLELVLNILFQGGSPLPQTGEIVFNDQLDGPAIVTLVGGSEPTYFVELATSGTQSFLGPTLSLSPTQSTVTKYADGRLVDLPNSVIRSGTVFNGAMPRDEYLDYSAGDFSVFTDDFRLLTTLPKTWTTKLDNDFYINFWNYGLSYDYLNLFLRTKDCNGIILDEYIMSYDGPGTASTVQTFNVGPAHINEICPTVDYIKNWNFWDDSDWVLTEQGDAIGSISGGNLLYSFTGPNPGRVRASQVNILTIGQVYDICVDVESVDPTTEISANNGIGIFATGPGEYCFSFTASSVDLTINIDGLSGTPAATINSVRVTQEVCDMIDCDVCEYDFRLQARGRDDREQVFPLAVAGAWEISNFNNALTFIDSSNRLQYSDKEEFGGVGASLVVQPCALTPGSQYSVTVNIINNENVLVQAGETGLLLPMGTTGSTGIFTQSFTASNENLLIALSGTSATQSNGATIQSVSVKLLDIFDTESEIYNMQVDCSCLGRYTNYPIIFKDRKGSFVTFNFDLNNRQRVNKTIQEYNKFVGDLKPDDSCAGGKYGYSLADQSNAVFSTLLSETWELNSDHMPEEYSVYLEELVTSPRAAIKIDGRYYSIIVTDTTFERVRKNNQKMIYLRLNIKFSANNGVQTL